MTSRILYALAATLGLLGCAQTPTPTQSRSLEAASAPETAKTAEAAQAGTPDNWPQFRGPGGLAHARTAHPGSWSASENVAWVTEIPGHGWSSPVVWDTRVFVTTAVSLGDWKEPTPGIYGNDYIRELIAKGHTPEEASAMVRERDNENSEEVPEGVVWLVLCLDAQTGELLWQKEVHRGVPFGGRHRKNTYASETPAVDRDGVYAYFGNVGLFAYSHEGDLLWKKSWEPRKMYLDFGTSSSPVVEGDSVYVLNDNQEASWFAAVNKTTGQEQWRLERPNEHPVIRSGFSTPFVWTNSLRSELVTFQTNTLVSYTTAGEELWRLGGQSAVAAPTPTADGDVLFIGSGSPSESVRPVFAVRAGASGNITLGEGEDRSEFVVWSRPLGGSYIPSQVVHDGLLYVLYDKGFFAAFDTTTGEELYKERLGRASTFSASPWIAGDEIYCLSEGGDTYVLRPGRDFELLRVNSLDELTLATPAAVDRSLFVRTKTKLYRIGTG